MDAKIRGQVAIWVVLGVVLVAAIAIFLTFERRVDFFGTGDSNLVFDMQSFLDGCTSEYVDSALGIMLPQGGFVEPTNYVFFDNTRIEYLCENRGFFEPCIQQHPMLLNEMKEEIKEYIQPRLTECLEQMRTEFSRRGGEIEFVGPMEIDVDLAPDRALIEIARETVITKLNETRRFEKLNVQLMSPAHNLAGVALEIAAQEATYCNFEYVGYMMLYPRYKITKYASSIHTKVYSIEDRKSGITMNVAIRGCAITSGI